MVYDDRQGKALDKIESFGRRLFRLRVRVEEIYSGQFERSENDAMHVFWTPVFYISL